MDMQLKPALRTQVDQWVALTGREANDLVEDALAGYFVALRVVGLMVEERYDDLTSGQVQLIDGEDAFGRLIANQGTQLLGASDYVLHPEALTDLTELYGYLAADTGNSDAGDRVITAIFDCMRTLALAPDQGHPRPDITARPLRFVRVGSRDVLIDYAPDEKPVCVIGVQNGRRTGKGFAPVLLMAIMARDEPQDSPYANVRAGKPPTRRIRIGEVMTPQCPRPGSTELERQVGPDAEFRAALGRIRIPDDGPGEDVIQWRFSGTIREVIERLRQELGPAWIVSMHVEFIMGFSYDASRNDSEHPIVFTLWDARPPGIGLKFGPFGR